MKKTLIPLLILSFCLVALTACGGGGDTAPALSGTYVFKSIQIGEDVFSADQVSALGLDASTIYLEFLDGDDCRLMLAGEETAGTYAVRGNSLAISSDGGMDSMTIDGNTIIMDDPELGGVMVFEKQ